MQKSKAHPGMDSGNLDDTHGTNQDIYEETEDKVQPLVSYRELFNRLKMDLDAKGYQLMATAGGAFCGFDLYKRDKLALEGLSQPPGFCYYRKINPSNNIDLTDFLAAIKGICEDAIANNKKEAKQWSEIYRTFSDDASNVNSALAKLSYCMIGGDTPVATLSGLSGYHKVVPQLSWFPEALQKYDISDLLTLFPDAEKKMFMLLLGRLMVGAKGTVVAEGDIDHTARSYAILVGLKGGMGKSTLMSYIRSALGVLGYTVAHINGNLGKFGWGSIALADLGYIDDLTASTQTALIKDNNLKSIVSNDTLMTEDKGLKAVSVRSQALVLGCTNSSNYKDYLELDSGSLSRLNQLHTYNEHELERKYPGVPDARIKPYWEAKAKEFGVSTTTLAARLLQQCSEMFLKVTGYSYTSLGRLKKDISQDRLEEATLALRDRFLIDTSLRHAEEIPDCLAKLTAIAIATASNDEKQLALRNLEKCDMNPDMLLALIEYFIASPELPAELKGTYPIYISASCKPYIKNKLVDFKRLGDTQSVEKAFTTLALELKSDKCFGYPQRSQTYQSRWIEQRRSIPDEAERFVKYLQENPIPHRSPLRDTIKTIRDYILDLES